MNSSLQDHQVVIISGASRGIGKAIAEYFIHQKYTVILIARNKDRLEAFANQHSQGNVHYYATDITDFKRMQSIVSEIIKQFGRIDILVNNAGIVKFGTSDISAENFEKMLDINLRAMFHLTNSIVPIMKQQQKGYI